MRLRQAVKTLQASTPLRYVAGGALSLAAVLLRVALQSVLQDQNRYAFLLPATIICAIFLGFGPGMFCCLLGVLLTMKLVLRGPNQLMYWDKSDVGGLVLFLALNIGILFLAHRETQEKRRRIETERKLEQLNAELEQKVAERTRQLEIANEELEGFCYSMAHDLRTPSRAIAGNARIMLEDHSTSLTPELQNHLRRINGAAIKLGSLLDGLLTHARLAKQELMLREVRIDELAREIAFVEARRMKAEVQLDSADGIVVNADERQMRVMLRALLDNAILYRKAGEPAHIRLSVEGGALIMADDGIGFDMAFAHKVFLPFERLHRDEAYPGVGIGLANVERVVQRHGGAVSIESVPEEGTRVRIALPTLSMLGAPNPEFQTTGS
ncbi:sensor histidine kinase [Fimbriimonas ginsengisoli]|uniref:histidine kinase n=1 Tax=Fimbriimonas ginsengisoli Gsoil 348 TaxID=661478 RepID=A0A068NJ34_FIMGI|nr:PAS domain-containing sensor histidine kinase [Fimbriimonas ginsengisoli]AIE83472.1 sensory box histidine kinase [Fimbriimonas ginsengisoli Gsoil 348]